MDPVDGGEAMSQRLSSTLVDAFMQFCQGNFAYRLPRTYARDDADTEAFFFNSVAAELERIVMDARRQEERLREVTERLSAALLRVAAGDLDVRLERDGKGDAVDVLLYLVNNTIAELAHLVRERERAAALEMERLNQLVEARTAQLRELAVTDALTGAMNRRRLFEVAEAMHAESERYGRPFGLAMLDLDRFKRINDEFGHAAGDRALELVADVIRGQIRATDKLGRYGGEELTVLFPETRLEAAYEAVERIRKSVERAGLVHGGRRVKITLSAGVVEYAPGEPLLALIDRADAALFRAKSAGRNRVERG